MIGLRNGWEFAERWPEDFMEGRGAVRTHHPRLGLNLLFFSCVHRAAASVNLMRRRRSRSLRIEQCAERLRLTEILEAA